MTRRYPRPAGASKRHSPAGSQEDRLRRERARNAVSGMACTACLLDLTHRHSPGELATVMVPAESSHPARWESGFVGESLNAALGILAVKLPRGRVGEYFNPMPGTPHGRDNARQALERETRRLQLEAASRARRLPAGTAARREGQR